MIKTTAGTIMNPSFSMAFQKLNQTQLDPYAAFRIKKVADTTAKVQDSIRKSYEEFLNSHAELDEKGQRVPDEEAPWGFKLKEGHTKETFDKGYDAFINQEVSINAEPLTPFNLAGVKISAAEFGALGPFVDQEAFEQESAQKPNVAQIRR